MAIQKEIWMQTIVEGLFADNSFMSKAVNADEFVEQGKNVHIPNAGAPSGTEKNRKQYPAVVKVRDDKDLEFPLDEYTTNPIRIPHADTVELSYSKRNSVVSQDRANLIENVSNDMVFNWSPEKDNCIRTTGKEIKSYLKGTEGTRRRFTKDDVLEAMLCLNDNDVPQEGRYMLLDAYMYAHLLADLTTHENSAFLASANVQKGILGRLYGFDIMMRSKTVVYSEALAAKELSAQKEANDCSAALAWQETCVCRALGEIKAFENMDDPTYYGDIYSFLVRAGGRRMRKDNKGVLAIVQDVVAV